MVKREQPREFFFNGKKYFHDGTGWIGSDYVVPPISVINYLDAELKKINKHKAQRIQHKYTSDKGVSEEPIS